VILDQVVVGTYGLVKSTDISAGHIKLDTVVEGTYGLVKSTDITSGHIKLSTCYGDLDDIDNGSTYSKLKTTDIDAGHIKLSSYTQVSGEWYDHAGVEIDASHGINIYGTNNALTTRATKTGTIQCYVGADGCIYAGGGNVKLDSGGIEIKGLGTLEFQTSGGYKRAEIGGGTYGLCINAEIDKNVSITTTGTNTSAKGIAIWAAGDEAISLSAEYINLGAEYAILPMRTSAPSSPPDGCMVFNPNTGYTNVYSSHDSAWHHFNRDAGWA